MLGRQERLGHGPGEQQQPAQRDGLKDILAGLGRADQGLENQGKKHSAKRIATMVT